jgi:predicted MFS family arabinose efflux permease
LLLLAARPGFVFLFNAASFLVVIDLLRRWRADSPSQRASKDQAQKLWPFIAEGLRFVGQDARMQMVLWRAGCFVIGGSAVWALLPSVAKRLIGTTGAGFGLMFGALGLGAVLAGVLLAAGRHSTSERVLMILGTLGFAVTTGGLPFCGGNLHVSIPLLLLGGMSWMTMMSTLNVAAQSALPNELRARGLSIYIVLFNGAMAFGSWMWGQAADRFPLPDVLFTACAGLLVSLTGVLLQKGR